MHPYLIQIGKFSLSTYGVMAAVGLILGLTLNVYLAKRDGIDEEKAWNLGVITILCGVLGAKLLLVINDWSYYSTHLRALFSLNLLQSGGVWYGGFLGGTLAGVLYAYWNKMPLLRTWDAFTPGISLGHAIGRLGCFAAGCCYGKPTDVAWGVVFRDPRAAALVGTPLGVRLHPTQIYEFLAEIAIFSLLMWMTKRRHFVGQIVGTYAFLYGIARFWLEFYRDDPDRGSVFGGAMSGTQLISIFLVLAGGALWWKKSSSSRELAAAS